MERIAARTLLKRNLKALLRHRGKNQGQLARFLRRKGTDDRTSDSWISHILDESDERELPMEYWDRAAEFLAVDTYHFFVPGIAGNELTERRAGGDRRKRADRRLGSDLPDRPRDLDIVSLIRALSPDGVEDAIGAVMKILDGELRRRRARPGSAGGQNHTPGNGATVPTPKGPRRKHKK